MAVLFSHAAHPVAVHIADNRFTADYPGYAVQTIHRTITAIEPWLCSHRAAVEMSLWTPGVEVIRKQNEAAPFWAKPFFRQQKRQRQFPLRHFKQS